MNEHASYSLAVIGGGAAGLIAAAGAAERAKELSLPVTVTVLERDDRVGRSILVTGNGRCNFSNAQLDASLYRNESFVEDVLMALEDSYSRSETARQRKIRFDTSNAVHAFFYRHGLMWQTDDQGRMYPYTNKASTIVDLLRSACSHAHVREICDQEIVAVIPSNKDCAQISLHMKDRAIKRFDAVIIACGGLAIDQLQLDNLLRVNSQPVLGALAVSQNDIPFVRALDNIRVRCTLDLLRPDVTGTATLVAHEKGELLFRKRGVSGICVFNLSRMALAGDILRLCFVPWQRCDADSSMCTRRKQLVETYGEQITYADMLNGLLLPRVSEALLKREGVNPRDLCSRSAVPDIVRMLMECDVEVAGIADPSACQVHRGGLDVREFTHTTLESLKVPNLYAAGEALDVDGPCGGYNLRWAWSSGLLAGRSAIEKLANNQS